MGLILSRDSSHTSTENSLCDLTATPVGSPVTGYSFPCGITVTTDPTTESMASLIPIPISVYRLAPDSNNNQPGTPYYSLTTDFNSLIQVYPEHTDYTSGGVTYRSDLTSFTVPGSWWDASTLISNPVKFSYSISVYFDGSYHTVYVFSDGSTAQ